MLDASMAGAGSSVGRGRGWRGATGVSRRWRRAEVRRGEGCCGPPRARAGLPGLAVRWDGGSACFGFWSGFRCSCFLVRCLAGIGGVSGERDVPDAPVLEVSLCGSGRAGALRVVTALTQRRP